MKKHLMMMAVALVVLTACEKTIMSDENGDATKGNVTLTFSPYEQTTRGTSPDGLFTKVNYMFYNGGTTDRVFSTVKTQTNDDAEFGTISLSLAAGRYDVLMVGHSSARSATLNKDKVSFTAYQGKKITDTFWQMKQIEVGEEPETYPLVLDRATAMFRLIIEDETPESVTHFKFEYKGGSADFNPSSGNGVSNSEQTEVRELTENSTYEVYTFPKDNGKLTITVYALDENETIVKQVKFENVPVKARTITSYKGKFFDGTTGVISGGSFTITVNGEWDEVNNYTF